MTTAEALGTYEAVGKIAGLLGETSQEIMKSIVFINESRLKKMNEMIALANAFYESDIEKRSELLGIELTMRGNV